MPWTDQMALDMLKYELYMAMFRYRERSTRKNATVVYDSQANTVVVGPLSSAFLTQALWGFFLLPIRNGGLGF